MMRSLRDCIGPCQREESMAEQQSQKREVRSEGQKERKARDSYAPIPPSNAVGGAYHPLNPKRPKAGR